MKVTVVGHGFVGKAVCSILKDSPTIVDINDTLSLETDIIFICVPTPTVEGVCDDKIVLEYIERLKDFEGIVVVKSTIPLSTVEKIILLRPQTVIWPELLREKHALEDIKTPRIIVIGSNSEDKFLILKAFIETETNIECDTIRHVSAKEASVFKYAVNSFLATKVLFMHQMYEWLEARGEGSSWGAVAELLALEGRVGSSHLNAPGEHGLGFAGSCFPKDTEALLSQSIKDGQVLELLKEVVLQNKALLAKK